jgi:hypothetical protein
MDAPVVGSIGLRVMLAAFGGLGLDAARIRSESSLDPCDLDDPDLLVPASRLYTMWEVAERRWARPALGLSAAAMVPVGAYEVLDYLILSSATIGDGLAQFAEYFGIATRTAAYEIHRRRRQVSFEMAWRIPPRGIMFQLRDHSLAVWWLRLGIRIERITPGHPEQNGRHERMHLTLKQEATRPAAVNTRQQQERFDAFLTRYNTERPHQALDMKVPGDLYTPSPRPYEVLGDLECPARDWTATVTLCGRICFKKRKVNLSQVFAGQRVGVKQVTDHIWLVTFMEYNLGYFDAETCRLEPIDNPFGPKVLPMSPE